MTVKFKNPPINELIIGVYFDSPIDKFRSEHIGLLWNKLRDRLPEVEQREPIFTEFQPRVSINIQSDFMPRFWFVSEDAASLIQVQRDAFLHNWRRRDSEYPHYSGQVKPRFDQFYDIFESFLQEDVGSSSPRIRQCELTYVDVIEACEYWRGPHDTANVIPSLSDYVRGQFGVSASAINTVFMYNIRSNTQLQIAVRTVASTKDSDSQKLVLEFRARGLMDGVLKSDTESWFSDAHKSIVKWFLSMTSADIQREYWVLDEDE